MEKECLVNEAAGGDSAPTAALDGRASAGEQAGERGAPATQFAVTIFLSAFLLFQVQPLMGRYILPWFGGGPAVWTACMLFFQVALLGGYTYAHLLSTHVPRRLHGWLHTTLLGASLLALPITPDPEIWKPAADDLPTLHILRLLLFNVGLPYLLLSSTGPLVQRWFTEAHPGRSPYRLYALSNTGSLLALLSYPIVFEPALTLGSQATAWSWVYGLFVILCVWSALRETTGRGNAPWERAIQQVRATGRAAAPRFTSVLLWLGLSAAASAMLLATTNQMCQEVAVVPFLWVLPLALYLLSFIVCFDHERWYQRRRFGLFLVVMAPLACAVLYGGVHVNIRIQIAIYSLTLFACCMTCHGELVRAKPDPRHLTLFYLLVAAGGALGGLLTAVGAPRLFGSGYWEFHVSLIACLALTLLAWRKSGAWTRYFREPGWAWAGAAAFLLALIGALGGQVVVLAENASATARNFYGILRLTDVSDSSGAKRALSHGKVVHGIQFLEAEKRAWPTAYYGPASGVGLAIKNHPRRVSAAPVDRNLRVGAVGLGVGTVAAFGEPGDYFRFYEINPDVVRFCKEYFSYVDDSKAEVEIVLGDARVQLEREAAQGDPQAFDILAVDAFSSDAIPIHLITQESVGLYLKHLKPDGLLLFHITNRSIDLTPVVRGLAEDFGLHAMRVTSPQDETRGISTASWAILARDEAFLNQDAVRYSAQPWPNERPPLLWTDDFASLWQILKR